MNGQSRQGKAVLLDLPDDYDQTIIARVQDIFGVLAACEDSLRSTQGPTYRKPHKHPSMMRVVQRRTTAGPPGE